MRSQDPDTLRIIDLWTFKSAKSNKRYIIEIEKFSNKFLGIKFYWKGVANSEKRYSLLTNDYEPRRIVMSCIHVMLEYYKRDNCCSFGFVAANDINVLARQSVPNKRFRFYRSLMLSVFGTQTFVQGYDLKNFIYVLINRAMLENGLISFAEIENEISLLYEGEYSLTTEGN